MELRSARITLDGLPLRVDFEWYNGEVHILEVYLDAWEILSIMDDGKISEARKKVLKQEES